MHPILLHFGHLALATFGVLAAVGLMLALWLSERTARLAGVDAEKLWDAGLFALLAAFVLSRLLLVVGNLRTFLAFPVLLLAVPSLTPAGLALTLLTTWAWLRWKRVPTLRALDAWAAPALLAWGSLALGHFAEGSDPGMPTRLPWGVRGSADALGQHPVALYVAAAAFLLAAAAYWWLRGSKLVGETAALAMFSAGLVQFLAGFVREPATGGDGLDPVQWVALALMLAGGLLRLGLWPAHVAEREQSY